LIEVNVLLLDSNISELLGKNKILVKLQENKATIKGLIKKLAMEHEDKSMKFFLNLIPQYSLMDKILTFFKG